jgi:hypothetical protein
VRPSSSIVHKPVSFVDVTPVPVSVAVNATRPLGLASGAPSTVELHAGADDSRRNVPLTGDQVSRGAVPEPMPMSLAFDTPVPAIFAEKITALLVINTGATKLANLTLAIVAPSASRTRSPSRANDGKREVRREQIAQDHACRWLQN